MQFETSNTNNNFENEILFLILPYLKSYGIIDEQSTYQQIREHHLRELAIQWGIVLNKSTKYKSDQLLISLSKKLRELTRLSRDTFVGSLNDPTIPKVPFGSVKFPKNYFGLSISSGSFATSDNLIIQCRKPKLTNVDDIENHRIDLTSDLLLPSISSTNSHDHEEYGFRKNQKDSNIDAQRKVSKTLLTMANNHHMMHLFISKGGIDAVFKLIMESRDSDILYTCSKCLYQAISNESHIHSVLDKDVLTSISILIERGDTDDIYHICSQMLFKLSCYGFHEMSNNHTSTILMKLVSNGILPICNSIVNIYEYNESIPPTIYQFSRVFIILSTINNIAKVLHYIDAEFVIRILLQAIKKYELHRKLQHAKFIMLIICNLSRLEQFTSILLEESALVIALHIMELHESLDITQVIVETFLNVSQLKKNRRDIALSGIASSLDLIFSLDNPMIKANALMMIGNLLDSGYLHDRIAKVDIIHLILYNMFPETFHTSSSSSSSSSSSLTSNELISTNNSTNTSNVIDYQLAGLSFFITQLGSNPLSPAAKVLIECKAIDYVIHMIPQLRGIKSLLAFDSLQYLWVFLINMSSIAMYSNEFIHIKAKLIQEIYQEAYEFIQQHQHHQQHHHQEDDTNESKVSLQHEVSQLCLNITIMEDFIISLVNDEIYLLTNALHAFISYGLIDYRIKAIKALTNLLSYHRPSRIYLLNHLNSSHTSNTTTTTTTTTTTNGIGNGNGNGNGNTNTNTKTTNQQVLLSSKVNIINIFEEYLPTIPSIHIYFISILNYLTCEESLISTLIDFHIHKFLISSVEFFTKTLSSLCNDDNVLDEYEEGKTIIASIYHNIMLKRPFLIPGTLTCFIILLNMNTTNTNTKSIRVLYLMKALSQLSIHSKYKLQLTKESKLIPCILAIMRNGCEEAERVQHFGAMVICNLFATHMDKTIIESLLQDRVIIDLVVITLLRINNMKTKEILSKACFNLLCKSDYRNEMIMNEQDILSAILELCKHESFELIQVCIRCLYNISCELTSTTSMSYASKLSSLKTCNWIINKLTSNIHENTSYRVDNHPTRLNAMLRIQCGMTLCNMSFDKDLAIQLVYDPKIIDAIIAIHKLTADEATYCCIVILYNLSFTTSCVNLCDSECIPILINGVKTGPALITQLSIAALVNLSKYSSFHSQLIDISLMDMIHILNSSQISYLMKVDIIHFLFNLLTCCPMACYQSIEWNIIPSLWKVLKAYIPDDHDLIRYISKIIYCICLEAIKSDNDSMYYKLLVDGIMHVLLHLSKHEISDVKYYISCCIFSFTTITNHSMTMKMLKADCIDILFWLTLHECVDIIGLEDVIRLNISHILRNLSLHSNEAEVLCREERFLSILKFLMKSTNETTLWETAGVIHNVLGYETCKKMLISKSIISLILQIAKSEYESVKHICSACLHLLQEHLPDIEDPLMLQLLWSILEADGDKLTELTHRVIEPIEFIIPLNQTSHQYKQLPLIFHSTKFIYTLMNFHPTWQSLIVSENYPIFQPIKLQFVIKERSNMIIKPLEMNKSILTIEYQLESPEKYYDLDLLHQPLDVLPNATTNTNTNTSNKRDESNKDDNKYDEILMIPKTSIPIIQDVIPPIIKKLQDQGYLETNHIEGNNDDIEKKMYPSINTSNEDGPTIVLPNLMSKVMNTNSYLIPNNSLTIIQRSIIADKKARKAKQIEKLSQKYKKK